LLLSCDGIVIVEFASGSFEGLASQTVLNAYDVPRGATCTFSITDIFGDGLFCFGEDECGSYAVLYGDDMTSIDGDYIVLVDLFEDAEDVITLLRRDGSSTNQQRTFLGTHHGSLNYVCSIGTPGNVYYANDHRISVLHYHRRHCFCPF
jgi:hypothetical protein